MFGALHEWCKSKVTLHCQESFFWHGSWCLRRLCTSCFYNFSFFLAGFRFWRLCGHCPCTCTDITRVRGLCTRWWCPTNSTRAREVSVAAPLTGDQLGGARSRTARVPSAASAPRRLPSDRCLRWHSRGCLRCALPGPREGMVRPEFAAVRVWRQPVVRRWRSGAAKPRWARPVSGVRCQPLPLECFIFLRSGGGRPSPPQSFLRVALCQNQIRHRGSTWRLWPSRLLLGGLQNASYAPSGLLAVRKQSHIWHERFREPFEARRQRYLLSVGAFVWAEHSTCWR